MPYFIHTHLADACHAYIALAFERHPRSSDVELRWDLAGCREALARLVEAGITHPVAFEIEGGNPENIIRDVHTHLMPHYL